MSWVNFTGRRSHGGIAILAFGLLALISNIRTSLFMGGEERQLDIETFSSTTTSSSMFRKGTSHDGTSSWSARGTDQKEFAAANADEDDEDKERYSCREGFRYFHDFNGIESSHNTKDTIPTAATNTTPEITITSTKNRRRRIPRVIHMASDSRCLSPREWTVAQSWRKQATTVSSSSYSYSIRLYDEAAVDKLLHQLSAHDMPHLSQYLDSCLYLFGGNVNDTDTDNDDDTDHNDRRQQHQFQVKLNIFKYLVLFHSGGIFVDLNLDNEDLNPVVVTPRDALRYLRDDDDNDIHQHRDEAKDKADHGHDEDDAIMIFDTIHHLPWHGFLAASPRHPFMYLAMAMSLHNIGSKLRNTSSLPDEHTGRYALHQAFPSFVGRNPVHKKVASFQNDGNTSYTEPLQSHPSFVLRRGGTYTGLEQRTVTVILLLPQEQEPRDAASEDTRFAAAADDAVLSSLLTLSPPKHVEPDAPVTQCQSRIFNAISTTRATAPRTSIQSLSNVVMGSSGGSSHDDKDNSNQKKTMCRPGLLRFEDLILPESITHANRKIPRIVHVTGKTRCLTPAFHRNLEKWKQLESHSVYFHDDVAIDRLLNNKNWKELFPHLHLVRPCIHTGAGLADLWRYLVLWEYGGIYSDMDSAPGVNLQNGTAIADNDDAFVVIESGRFLAQYWISASPKHPLMFHSAYNALQNLMQLPNIGEQYVPIVTGPRALVDGFEAFLGRRDHGARYPQPGHYVGRDGNRTATVRGPAKDTHLWVQRLAVAGTDKDGGYASMGIIDYNRKQALHNVSCYSRMLQTVSAAVPARLVSL